MPIDIVAYAFTLLRDNLGRNSCTLRKPRDFRKVVFLMYFPFLWIVQSLFNYFSPVSLQGYAIMLFSGFLLSLHFVLSSFVSFSPGFVFANRRSPGKVAPIFVFRVLIGNVENVSVENQSQYGCLGQVCIRLFEVCCFPTDWPPSLYQLLCDNSWIPSFVYEINCNFKPFNNILQDFISVRLLKAHYVLYLLSSKYFMSYTLISFTAYTTSFILTSAKHVAYSLNVFQRFTDELILFVFNSA